MGEESDYVLRLQAQQMRNRMALEESVLEHLIIRTPTSDKRNKLTDINIHLKEIQRILGELRA